MKSKQEETFEGMLSRLEAIVRELEAGGLGLEASMARFEEGVSLLRKLRDTLAAAEKKVEELSADGSLVDIRMDWERP